MFKKLHSFEDSSISMKEQKKKQQTTYKKNFIKNASQRKKINSYGQKFRKKNNLVPQVPELEIVESDGFIFQGRLASVVEGSSLISTERQKHGQGVMFLKNGTLIVGFWDHGLLHGRAMIFTPFGGKTIAEFYNGKLNGWAITTFVDKLIVCTVYYENKIDGEKIIFEANQKMWVGSKYVQQTNTYKIVNLEKGKMNILPSFLNFGNTEDLMELYEEFIIQESCCMILKQIQYVSITSNLTYIGYCNQEGQPQGLGAIFGKNQFYLGHFRQGSLQCFGRMIFQNGQIYQGQLLGGVFYGQGTYYNPSKNQSTIMSTNREQQKIIDEQEGYICINCPSCYFKINKNGQTGMIGDPLRNICEILEKYYSRFFIEITPGHSDNMSDNSEFGVSEDVDGQMSNLASSGQRKQKKQDKVQNGEAQSNQKRWLNFNAIKSQQKRGDQSSFGQSSGQIPQGFQRAYSLDKRDAANMKKHLAEQSFPVNIEEWGRQSKLNDESLQDEINKLRMDRNFSMKQQYGKRISFLQTSTIKQNLHPSEVQKLKHLSTLPSQQDPTPNFTKRNTLNVQNNSRPAEEAVTFRNKNSTQELQKQLAQIEQARNQRKYSHMVESKANYSPQDSVVSNLSHKVYGLMEKTKRRKIFL